MFINNGAGLTDNNLRSANGQTNITINGKKYTFYDVWQNTNSEFEPHGRVG